ncbi:MULTISPECIES: GntR family transcriptional regulator [Bacillaceae]|uniref:GntR family transcriptional regulator n=1 Tax=Bacillaceae TaxID=186817 RepID=UPI0008922902|nr:GntR family transcriptional regulator [Bacillus sp. OK048]SDL99942.1 DNA-binding transcriptional regulator, GntR family [Bacillus sp. OK048]
MKIDLAYRYIKTHIIDGTWEPETAINVNEVTAHLNISRTPVHKALAKLEQEGFLEIIPQVGVFVKRPEQADVIERLLVCANLDALMTEHAVEKLNEEELTYMKEILTTMDNPDISVDEYSSLNIEFHRTIYEAAKLTYALSLAKQLWDYLNYVGKPSVLFSKDRRKQSQAEHWMIYYTLKEKDSKLAKNLMERHLLRVAEAVRVSQAVDSNHPMYN